MKREQILATFRSLAMSRGFYGRLLDRIYAVDEDTRENFLSELEEQNFRDTASLVMYIEG